MIALANFKNNAIRPSFLFGLGAHLATNGLLILSLYYLVTQISRQQADELLGWVVPTAQGCCLFAAIALAAGLSARDPQPGTARSLSPGWLIRKIIPFGSGRQPSKQLPAPAEREPSASEVENALSLLKTVDWKVFKDVGIAYFREVGFSALDQPKRSKGVDFLLYTSSDYRAVAVRCLPRGTEQVELQRIRDFHRTMLLAGAVHGIMLTTGVFDEDAVQFGIENGIETLGGPEFIRRILSLPPETSRRVLEEPSATESVCDGAESTA